VSSDPLKALEEFLAAPEQVLKDEKELNKAKLRKEKDRARKARERASKLKETPSAEDLLADLIRVAEDPETNPWWKTRTISRKRYELWGHYPIEHVEKRFGQFNHALEVAGLRDQPGTRLWKAKRAKESRAEHAARYLERYAAPYVADPRRLSIGKGSYKLISLSDTHGLLMDPFVFAAAVAAAKDVGADGFLLNGDIIDGNQLSTKHPKPPGYTPALQDELDHQWWMHKLIREELGPDIDLFNTNGNHDLMDRLGMYLTQVAPSLADLRSLKVDRLLGLDEFDVKLFHGGSFVSPEGTEDAHTGFLLFGFYRVHHGWLMDAEKELAAAGRSGQSGHLHRAKLAYGTTEATEGMSWMTTPMGCRHEAGRWYLKGTTAGWTRGFGYAELFPDGAVHQYPCVVSVGADGRERVSCEGFTYTRPDDMADPSPVELWINEGRDDHVR
jgi:hypothetical protein